MAASPTPTIDIESLGLDQGALLLIRPRAGRTAGGRRATRARAIAGLADAPGSLVPQPRASAALEATEEALVTRGPHAEGRWLGAQSTGAAQGDANGAPAEDAAPGWGLAARGATVEAGSPPFFFALHRRDEVWAATAGELYRQAAAAQWDPGTAIDGTRPSTCRPPWKQRSCRVMTCPHRKRECCAAGAGAPPRADPSAFPRGAQLLALQCADEARHVEVFTRRATCAATSLRCRPPAVRPRCARCSMHPISPVATFTAGRARRRQLREPAQLSAGACAHRPGGAARSHGLAARDERTPRRASAWRTSNTGSRVQPTTEARAAQRHRGALRHAGQHGGPRRGGVRARWCCWLLARNSRPLPSRTWPRGRAAAAARHWQPDGVRVSPGWASTVTRRSGCPSCTPATSLTTPPR